MPSFRSPAGGLYPRSHGLSGLLRNLELYRSAGFLLKDEGAARHALAVADVAYPQLHEFARTELAIDSQIVSGRRVSYCALSL